MSNSTLWIIIAVVVADLIFVPMVIYAIVNGLWSPMVRQFPSREHTPDAVTKNFQSYKIGLLNLGYMVHTTVDDMCLHLQPAKLGRVLGMKALSVPWEEITPVRRRGKRYAEVKIGSNSVIGPRWALELAFMDHDDEHNPHTAG